MTRILVTGVGGGVGQSIVKSLQQTEHEVIGVDGEFLGAGLYAVPKSYVVPYASDPEYISKILDICRQERCSIVFPGLDAELPILAKAKDAFQEVGATLIVSSREVVSIADDKLDTFHFLKTHNFNAPATVRLTENVLDELALPFVLKPKRGGARSQGVFKVLSKKEFEYLFHSLDHNNYVAQQFISGDEYTSGTLTIDGKCHGSIVMRRILRDGDTYKAFVVNDPTLDTYMQSVANELKPFGPCNFQFRLHEGQPYIFEINARCSGTTYSRTLAGFNEPLMMVDYLTLGRLPKYSIREITILRYWKELVVENPRVQSLKDNGWLLGDGGDL
jgi:carbamoyl-phosphate synthase large subunit